MLKSPTVVSSNGVSDAVISGNGGGVKVHCTKEALPVYNTLVGIANNGNHHARLAVSGIVGLSSGHQNMNNVYKPNSKALSNTRKELFTAVLPGISILFKQEDNGSVILLKINLDDAYTKQQREFTSPGLWKAKKVQDQIWHTKFIDDGKLSSDAKNRFVIVSDRSEGDPNESASEIFNVLKSSRDKTTVKQITDDGFDLHYTPGKGSIGGLRNMRESRHANTSASLKESAEILAHTMYNARNVSGVVWGSESGGSGVLTQAMQILANKGIKLESHGIFLNRSTTLPSVTIELAGKLGISSDDITKKGTISLDQLAGRLSFSEINLVSNSKKLINDDNYSVGSLVKDTAKGIYSSVGSTNTVIGAGGLMGLGLAASPVVATVGGILAMSTLLIKSAEKIAPEFVQKHFK